MPFDPSETTDLRLVTLAQLTQGGGWQLELAHDRAEHLLIWITRGQGVALLDGSRRGVGTHNALFIPARHLMALEMMRNGFGQALVIPPASGLTLPRSVQHLRIRDVASQSELTGLIDALGREQSGGRPLRHSAMRAYGELIAIWLRRHIDDLSEARPSAAHRLVQAYCARLVDSYGSGAGMADIAQEMGVTPTHLTRVCRSETGRTAAALLTERILYAARRLLTATDTPVQDIARHLGFGSAAYFTRFIQQHTGHTPTALRRAARPDTK
ncbi:helix-turn-helix transcriptional regulator [Pseudodonghicola flavimaris]|uniref:Helix-turn-helix transcriptional regulator n=1 Tax=Pseudodonghicola flavimaris TaxID=3050036 RepID=A0ABT7F701_9RHOB|nr:AraC family transcriptional regulator [Pseudodonghicola flavimaris]MDK3020389.1 helix-turn-helix transcriptional regulator [Pseudodonghicola flavimaris]